MPTPHHPHTPDSPNSEETLLDLDGHEDVDDTEVDFSDPNTLARLAAEPLDPELADWVENTDTLGLCLKHPLVFSVPLLMPGLSNRQYRDKKAALTRALANQDWHGVVFLHERAYRSYALFHHVVGMDPDGRPRRLIDCAAEVRDLAVEVWTDSENLHQYIEEWRHALTGWKPGDPLLLANDDERAAFADLPDELVLYRGDCDDGGWSWTLDEGVARFFANRFGANHDMLTGKVSKREVFGYITRRGENEILAFHETVRDITKID